MRPAREQKEPLSCGDADVSSVAATHARVRDRPSAIALKLGLLVVAVATVLAALATRGSSPWIIPDELLYSEMAKSIAGGHLPAIRGVTSFSFGVVYPTLISPAWLFTSPAT